MRKAMRFRLGTVAAVALLAACGDDTLTVNLGTGSRLTFVQGSRQSGTVNLFIDGQLVGTNGVGNMLRSVELSPGPHTIEALPVTGGAGFTRTINFGSGDTVTIIAWDSATSTGATFMRPAILLDTGAIVPAGATKLRVAYYAAFAGNIDLWRTQPDFPTPTRVAFPVSTGFVSPYLQSTVGSWRVMVSTATGVGGSPAMPDTLANSGLIPIADGRSKTVVVLDKSPVGIEIVVVDP